MLKLLGDEVGIVGIDDPDTTGDEYADPSLGKPVKLFIPDIAKSRCDQGIVKYVGPQVRYCKIGMYVLFSGYSGQTVGVKGEGRVIVLRESFVVAEIAQVPATMIPGLYFKEIPDIDKVYSELLDAVASMMPGLDLDIAAQIADGLRKRGFIGPKNSPYYTATYELMMEYLGMAVRESEWAQKIKVIPARPTQEDYDTMRRQPDDA